MLGCNRNYCLGISPPSNLDEAKILQQLPGGRIIVLNTVHSTNQYIIDNIQNIQSGDVFVTEHQTQGRGRRGKFWITPNGQSICLSIYWKLYRTLQITVELSLIISLVVAQVLKKIGAEKVKIKWPNDLYVYDQKLAGVLIETITKNNKISHLVIGIGINISICACTKLKIKISKNWTDLKNIGITPNRNMLVINLVDMLRWTLKQFEYNKCISFIYYQKFYDYLYNKPIKLFYEDHIKYGTALGIYKDGTLLVMDKSGMIHRYLRDDISVCKT